MRMMGRYFSQCPACRTHRKLGPCCGGGGPEPHKKIRAKEKRQFQREILRGEL